jgi:hypothetical protein
MIAFLQAFLKEPKISRHVLPHIASSERSLATFEVAFGQGLLVWRGLPRQFCGLCSGHNRHD